MNEQDLVYRLKKRAEIRRQISSRKSVQEGAPDRISDLLEEAANEIGELRLKRSDMTKTKTWTVIPEEDPATGELILPFPPEFCDEQDWQIGDTLEFKVNDDQSCIITNISWEERHKDEVAES